MLKGYITQAQRRRMYAIQTQVVFLIEKTQCTYTYVRNVAKCF